MNPRAKNKQLRLIILIMKLHNFSGTKGLVFKETVVPCEWVSKARKCWEGKQKTPRIRKLQIVTRLTIYPSWQLAVSLLTPACVPSENTFSAEKDRKLHVGRVICKGNSAPLVLEASFFNIANLLAIVVCKFSPCLSYARLRVLSYFRKKIRERAK